MDRNKFARMVREFPFLAKVFAEQNLREDNVESITVCRGDKNLMEVKPRYESHDIGEHGDYMISCQFWLVTAAGDVWQFLSSNLRTEIQHGIECDDRVFPIGTQLILDYGSAEDLRNVVTHIIECSGESWSTCIDEWCVSVYKMKGFDWDRYCRSTQLIH